MSWPRLYVISSSGLNKGKGAAQSAHAVAQFGIMHREAFEEWGNSTIVLVRGDVTECVRKVHDYGMSVQTGNKRVGDLVPLMALNHEPDMDDALTAIAVLALNETQYNTCKELFKDLPLL